MPMPESQYTLLLTRPIKKQIDKIVQKKKRIDPMVKKSDVVRDLIVAGLEATADNDD